MMNLGLNSTFPGLRNTVVKKRELIIKGIHMLLRKRSIGSFQT